MSRLCFGSSRARELPRSGPRTPAHTARRRAPSAPRGPHRPGGRPHRVARPRYEAGSARMNCADPACEPARPVRPVREQLRGLPLGQRGRREAQLALDLQRPAAHGEHRQPRRMPQQLAHQRGARVHRMLEPVDDQQELTLGEMVEERRAGRPRRLGPPERGPPRARTRRDPDRARRPVPPAMIRRAAGCVPRPGPRGVTCPRRPCTSPSPAGPAPVPPPAVRVRPCAPRTRRVPGADCRARTGPSTQKARMGHGAY